jgi:hypothetical protein
VETGIFMPVELGQPYLREAQEVMVMAEISRIVRYKNLFFINKRL